MTFSDPVAHMLTKIRNANMRSYRSVEFPHSNFKWQICKKLRESNFLDSCKIDKRDKRKWVIKVEIKYKGSESRIHQLKKISKPSQHIHLRATEIAKNCQRHGVYLFSTSLPETPLLTHREALAKKQGGKLILFID